MTRAITGGISYAQRRPHSRPGVVTALAAIPGLVDYVRTVPPNSSAKRRGTMHMVLNLAVVMLFVAGWHGGVLVSRDQISVDHRYARAGQWREVSVRARAGTRVTVARADELDVNQRRSATPTVTSAAARLVLLSDAERHADMKVFFTLMRGLCTVVQTCAMLASISNAACAMRCAPVRSMTIGVRSGPKPTAVPFS